MLFLMTGEELDVKELAGKWHIVLQNITRSQEQISRTVVIYPDGIFRVVSPHLGEPVPLSKSTNDSFPANTGWYQTTYEGSMFVRLRKDGNLEMHYFDKDMCKRTYKGISSYCVTAIGTRKSKLSCYF